MRVAQCLIGLSLFVPYSAYGQAMLCVAPSGGTPTECTPGGVACDGIFTSFAAATIDAASRISTGRPQQISLCTPENGPIPERIVLDNSGDQLGAPLTVGFAQGWVCPPPGDAPTEPAVTVVPGTNDSLGGLRVEFGTTQCGSDSRPGLRVSGPGDLTVFGGEFDGTTDYAISVEGSLLSVLQLNSVQVRNCTGMGLMADKPVALRGSRFPNCLSEDMPLVSVGPGADLDIKGQSLCGEPHRRPGRSAD